MCYYVFTKKSIFWLSPCFGGRLLVIPLSLGCFPGDSWTPVDIPYVRRLVYVLYCSNANLVIRSITRCFLRKVGTRGYELLIL